MSHVTMGKGIPSRGNAKRGDPEAGACLVCVEDEAGAAAVEGGRGWAGDGEERGRPYGTLAFRVRCCWGVLSRGSNQV